MSARLFAGFEGARLHWNGHDTLLSTRHTPDTDMTRHYRQAVAAGATGFRDTLPERFNPRQRWDCARRAVPETTPIIWSLVHFDQPLDPVRHAQSCARVIGPHDRLIAVNEPSVGHAVAGQTREEAMLMAGTMMGAALVQDERVRFWTCDPAHETAEHVWWVTDHLVRQFGKAIEVIGINHHAGHGGVPLRDILRCAADRYPDHRIALTECSWHDGHGPAEARFPFIRSRREWWDHVQGEIDASGVQLACACWMPWLDMAWEPGPGWPNGWPWPLRPVVCDDAPVTVSFRDE